ncbi:MAG TPA: site-specific integrase [Myxococcota bacterium]|nr:site-specific integrase [Myxococcota bacterium]HRV17890.1 site-specific integrase [Myxococcota bacterium]
MAYKSKPKPPLADQSMWLEPIALLSPKSHPVLTYAKRRGNSVLSYVMPRIKAVALAASNGLADELTFPWHQLERKHLLAINDWLVQNYSQGTATGTMCTVRSLIKECWLNGFITAEEYMSKVDTRVADGFSATFHVRRVLSAEEKLAFVLFCKNYQKKRNICLRDVLLFGLGCFAGLGQSDICNLTLESYRPEESALLVRSNNGNERMIPLTPGLKRKLDEWMVERGDSAGYLIGKFLANAKVQVDTPLSVDIIRRALRDRARMAGIPFFSPFDLRATFQSDMIDAGADLAAIKAIMGLKTDKGVVGDRISWLAKQRAMALLPDLFVNETENPDLYIGEINGGHGIYMPTVR